MKNHLKIILMLAIFGLLGLYVWQADLINTYVLEPVARILWLFYRALRVVDQKTYWLMLIFFVLFLILRILPKNNEFPIRPSYKKSNQKHDRVFDWETMIKGSKVNQYERLRLVHSLQTLSQSIEEFSFRNDQISILLPTHKTGIRGWIQQVNHCLLFPQHKQWKMNLHFSEMETKIEEILISMEKQMESNHE